MELFPLGLLGRDSGRWRITVDQVEQEIAATASGFSFIRRVTILDKTVRFAHRRLRLTANTIKSRLEVSRTCFIQIYRNVKKNLTNFVLIAGNTRIYGRDCDGGNWHRHPYEEPDSHDFSHEGSRQVELSEFLQDVQEILENEGIL